MADATTAAPSGAFDGAAWSALATPVPVLSAVPPVAQPTGDSTLLLELSPRVRRAGQDEVDVGEAVTPQIEAQASVAPPVPEVVSMAEKRRRMMAFVLPWKAHDLVGFALGAGAFQEPVVPPTERLPMVELEPVPVVHTAEEAEEEAEVKVKASRQPTYNKAANQEARRAKVILAWLAIVSLSAASSGVGLQFVGDQAEDLETVRLSLAIKRTNTLTTRLSAITQYINWCCGAGVSGWPPTEEAVYGYMRAMARAQKAKTRCKQLLEALHFWHGVFRGSTGEPSLLKSGRIGGLSAEQMQALGVRKQAVELDASTIETLENWVCYSALAMAELVVAGGLLLMVSLRARFDDLQDWVAIEIIEGNIYVQVLKTKTSGKLGSRLKLFLIGPLFMLTGLDWFEAYSSMRIRMGIPMPEWPLFPALVGGQWLKTQACVGDINIAIRLLLKRAEFPRFAEAGTHSAKATLLSWAAKAGLAFEVRAALGYHAGRVASNSVIAYSRDALEHPLGLLRAMLATIVEGSFNPDRLSRARRQVADGAVPLGGEEAGGEKAGGEEEVSVTQYWERVADPQCSPTQPMNVEVEASAVEPDLLEANGDTSESAPDDDSSEVDGSDWIVQGAYDSVGIVNKGDMRRFQHSKYLTIHAGRQCSSSLTACNRKLSLRYITLAAGEDDTELDLMCRSCFVRGRAAQPAREEDSEPSTSDKE